MILNGLANPWRRAVSLNLRNAEAHLRFIHHGKSLPTPPKIEVLSSPEDSAAARLWISQFRAESIPRSSVEMSFSRSSGPGGQNVNKVNTKATVRCPVDSRWIPAWARADLKASPHYVASTNSILITSTVFRSQAQNVEDCLSKLHALIVQSSSASIRNEPSEQQKKRVAGLERAEKERRRVQKSHRSEVKKGRASGKGASGWD